MDLGSVSESEFQDLVAPAVQKLRTVKQIDTELKQTVLRQKIISKLQNEGAGGFIDDDKITALLKEKKSASFLENWSEKQTIQKRKLWNDEVRSMEKAGTFDHTASRKIEEKLGFKMTELKKAVEFYKNETHHR